MTHDIVRQLLMLYFTEQTIETILKFLLIKYCVDFKDLPPPCNRICPSTRPVCRYFPSTHVENKNTSRRDSRRRIITQRSGDYGKAMSFEYRSNDSYVRRLC